MCTRFAIGNMTVATIPVPRFAVLCDLVLNMIVRSYVFVDRSVMQASVDSAQDKEREAVLVAKQVCVYALQLTSSF